MRMLLAGEWVDRPETIEILDPEDGSLVDTVPRASLADIETALTAADACRPAARTMAARRRATILSGAAAGVEARHEEFARMITAEGIKTIREARKEVSRAIITLRLSAEEATRTTGEMIRFDQSEGGEHRIGYFTREPVGVVVAITPYNDPLNLVAHKVGPAIAGGNVIIVKPDSRTPLSALKLAEVIEAAGAPPGMIQVVTGPGSEIGDVLVRDGRVRMVSFTGGNAAGEEIMRGIGLKRAAMELGSNCPVIIMPDADLDLAISASLSGAFWAAGQNCLHVQRLLIHDDVYDDVAERFVKGARDYVVGSKKSEATDMGPLISLSHTHRVVAMVEEAVAAGATLLTGGETHGTFHMPTVLAEVPGDCRIMREEVYGPVTVLIRFGSLEEAIRLANDADYGLQAGIFTGNLGSAHRAIADLEVGGVMVNDSSDYRIDSMPFGGVKGSGFGREGVRWAIEGMTEMKVACLDLGSTMDQEWPVVAPG